MKRWLPAPMLTATLWLAWLLLNNSLDAAQVALGAVLAVAIPLYTGRLWPGRPRPRRPGLVLRLGLVVLWDIVLSNLEVARRILGPEAKLRPGFVWLPLAVRDPYAIATLAGIITLTPGTVSSELSPDRRHLLIHALHLEDPQALVQAIKRRYEAPLLEIFP
jgi:multicomponent K+:H+ antiporter subunit E